MSFSPRYLVLALMFFFGPILSASAEPRTVRIAVLAFLDTETMDSQWAPLLAHLATALPGYTPVLVQLDQAALQAAVTTQSVDFVITNPGNYVALEMEFGISRIATLDTAQAPSPVRAVGSAVIVRADRQDLRSLADLAGKRVIAVGENAFGGFQVAWREFVQLGIDPFTDFAQLDFVGLPMHKVTDAVTAGRADAGIVRACTIESLPARLSSGFRVLSPRREPDFPCQTSTRLYPDWPIATLRSTPPALAKSVATALLAMPVTVEGMSWTVPADYQAVHELFRELQTGPYSYLKESTLRAAVVRYWPLVLMLATLMVAWIIYTVRVEYLVQARTTALRQALDERKAIEERMRVHQEQVEHLSRLSILGELSGTLAHEINQPLASIGNYAQSLVLRVDNGRVTDAAVREASLEIAGQAARAAGILSRIRGFSRKRATVRERRVLAELVRETVVLFLGMLSNRPEIRVDEGTAANCAVEVDPLQIQQIMLNLLKNGLDAMQDLPDDQRRLDILLRPDKGTLHIAVRDYGRGLAPEAREHLFEPFFTTKPDGLGLGLSICTTIIEAHGGHLSAQPPAEGPGLVFTFTLPIHD
ncbi:MAG: PhnD/SsuA/transferrin family substrate-binding protein [Rhodoferax sp.]|uniref:sensor histidine kinase n=1 Tax=Rhodoferax sp. TaxID=50421 RepID=UPI001830259F|nr:PhnD/SsuA/transferrin family substrate-binding protein [Rhodoferax sp.]NMM14544.1 PhnD/SsuA/transferrin family substrate-binding protein [Rhodoferax sp.]NMM21221.1 PhnD/SsuA/transferrin family substrate-binding protein [Rhodoferax sp.]